MNKRRMVMWLGSAALLASGSAMAHVDVAVGLGFPVAPVYAPPPPVYVAPQPAIVAYPDYGYYYDDDRRYRKWRKHEYKRWRKHYEDDDDD